ncbi:hypothetical protein [Streptomyces sp. NPDC059378]|uniref:hypothetical protein n=1 Tax=Streptomyces sp. NPDC059378 TaxID=3346815 RepID=UPI0036A64695
MEEGTVPAHEPSASTEAGKSDDGGGPSAVAAPPGHGTVVLSRVRGSYRDALRRYAVLLDDAQVGSIGRGQTLRLEVPSGAHQLQLKIDWCSSRPLTALVEPGRTVCFISSPGGDASEGLADVSANRGHYITLQQTPEPVVMTKTPLVRRTRLQMGAAIGFFGGGITLIGALIWHFTGMAPEADNAVAGASLALTLASMIVFRLGRRRRARQRPRT